MKLKRLFLLVVVGSRLFAGVGEEERKTVITNMKSASDAMTSLYAKMKQKKKSAFMEKEVTTKADFYFMKPGKYSLRPNNDAENQYIVNGNDVWIINRKNKTVTTTSESDFSLNQYVIGFGGAIETLEKYFAVTVDVKQVQKKFGSYKISLTPLKTSKFYEKLEKITILVRDDLWLPYHAELSESDGDTTTWEFSDFKLNSKIKDDIFKQEVPKGFQVKKYEK